jgi:signal transduction histidine kinase/ligand-binding sensor domain-containing protein
VFNLFFVRFLLTTLLLLYSGICAIAVAQTLANTRFASLHVEDGLSRGGVTGLYQDDRGYFWISTDDGLNQYDGEEIRTYRTAAESVGKGRKANRVAGHLCEDQNNNIWYMNETGMYCCNPVRMKLTHHPFPPDFSAPADLKAVAIFSKLGCFWFFSPSQGLYCYRYDHPGFPVQHFPLPLPVYNAQIVPDVDDQQQILIAAGTEGGLLVFDTRKEKYYTVFAGTRINDVWYQSGLYFLLTDQSILRCYTLQRAADFIPLPPGKVLAILEDRFERVWACTEQAGLWYFDRSVRNWTKCVPEAARSEKVLPDLLSTIYLDRSDNLWIGSSQEGVYRTPARNTRFRLFPAGSDAAALRGQGVSSILPNRDTSVWIGWKGEGLYHLFLKDGHFEKASNQYGNTLFRDRSGTIWTSGKKGLAIIAATGSNASVKEMSLSVSLNIGQMTQTGSNTLLAIADSSIWEITNATPDAYKLLCIPTALPNQPYTDIWADANGQVWLIVSQKGLWRASKNKGGKWEIVSQHLEAFEINDFIPDPQNNQRLWLATSEGLVAFDTNTGQYRLYEQPEGLSFRMLHSVAKDSCCDLWMATEAGLCRMQETETRPVFYNYDINDGLLQTDFYPGVSEAGPGGYMFFGGTRGLTWFPARESRIGARQRPLVSIDQILVNGYIVSADSGKVNIPILQLPTEKNDLDFRIAVLDFTRPSANKIQYILEGRDNHWSTFSGERMVRYTNMPPGLYTLRVKGGNAQGIWSEEKQIKIRIKAPFWTRTTIIFLLSLFITIGFIWWINERYRKALREQQTVWRRQTAIEAERSRIAKDMHDEIGSGLSQIALMTELMNAERTKDKQARQYGKDIGNNARRLVQSISEIIWALSTQHDSLDSLLAYMREQTYAFFEPFEDRVYYEVEFPDHLPAHPLSNQQRRNLYLVAKESLNNALKHSHAKNIRLTLDYQPDLLTFSVLDDGRGLDPARKPDGGGFGLPGMRRRMEEVGGSIEWQSRPKGGTAVVFKMPLS